ncbi:hypothetical protein DOTSEDRAFT_75739 [Dothistroma septosporum NZE10]|uniref:Uncharacterized protein n=1 Tax=Dothistroma septosporum (strain NZE10 / CBS 128990) TaxID=675120 RepID=N1PBM5_DOTSN|nr:hypothetical protein DOTSEDRAFT_75739 [Dothistroma septosporum NZE10]
MIDFSSTRSMTLSNQPLPTEIACQNLSFSGRYPLSGTRSSKTSTRRSNEEGRNISRRFIDFDGRFDFFGAWYRHLHRRNTKLLCSDDCWFKGYVREYDWALLD